MCGIAGVVRNDRAEVSGEVLAAMAGALRHRGPDSRRLVLARDRLGKKPLYWHHGPAGLAFASELGALTACPDVPRTIDERAVADFLTYHYVPDPRSIYAGVHKLPPGHFAVFRPAGS